MGILGDIAEGFVRTIVAGLLVLLALAVLMGGMMWSAENNSTFGGIITFIVSLGLMGAGITVGRMR